MNGYTEPMDTYTLAQEFSGHCYSRGLRPKTLELYKWGATKLVNRCPEMPTDVAQVNVVFDDPALGRRSRSLSGDYWLGRTNSSSPSEKQDW